MKVKRLDDIDAELELAIEDLRGYCSRLAHGRVTLVLDRHERSTVGHDLSVDVLTTEDLERLMRERPRARRAGRWG